VDQHRAVHLLKTSDNWRQRVKVARKERHPGDILTFAGHADMAAPQAIALAMRPRPGGTAPLEQAREGCSGAFEMDRDNFEAQSFLALVDNRLGCPPTRRKASTR
jgi:hypothetical protein